MPYRAPEPGLNGPPLVDVNFSKRRFHPPGPGQRSSNEAATLWLFYHHKLAQVDILCLEEQPRSRRLLQWWAHQDSNLEPKDYESSALTVEL